MDMKKLLSMMTVLMLVLSLLSGCDSTVQLQEEGITLNVYNWGQYIADGSDGSLDIIAAFEEKYPNIHVNYSTFDSNEIMYSKLSNGGITVDVIFPSDYMVARMIDEGMLMELNYDNIPNYRYIDEVFKNTAYDPAK